MAAAGEKAFTADGAENNVNTETSMLFLVESQDPIGWQNRESNVLEAFSEKAAMICGLMG